MHKVGHTIPFLFLLLTLTIVQGHPNGHSKPNSHGEDHSQETGGGCTETCFKFSSLSPHRSGERFLQGKCTITTFRPVPEEICTCFFNLGYHCYIDNEYYGTTPPATAGTTPGMATTYVAETTPYAAETTPYPAGVTTPYPETTPYWWSWTAATGATSTADTTPPPMV